MSKFFKKFTGRSNRPASTPPQLVPDVSPSDKEARSPPTTESPRSPDGYSVDSHRHSTTSDRSPAPLPHITETPGRVPSTSFSPPPASQVPPPFELNPQNADSNPPSTSVQPPRTNPLEMNRTAEFLKNQGNRLLQQGDILGAIENYTFALEQAPGNPIILSNRAAAYSQLTSPDWEKSFEDAKTATDTDPSFWKAWSRRGLASFNLSRPRDALTEYRRAETEFRRAEGATAALGEALTKGLENAQKAVNELEAQERAEAARREEERRRREEETRRREEERRRAVPPPMVPPAASQPVAGTRHTLAPSVGPTSSTGRTFTSGLAADLNASEMPPGYSPNLSHPDATVRLLSLDDINRRLDELEEMLKIRNKGSFRIESLSVSGGYNSIAIFYVGCTLAEIANVDMGRCALDHPAFGKSQS